MTRPWPRIVAAGIAAGFVGNGVLGVLFSTPAIRRVLYDPAIQSALFIEVTPRRDVPLSVAGLILLSVIHAWLFHVFLPAMPGGTWVRKGLFWGLVILLMYWLFQEWFIYHTLLGEPWLLNLLELCVLAVGSFVEGAILAWFLARKNVDAPR